VLLAAAISGWSQEITAAINGVVTDPTGAAVAGAKVTAKDLDRGSVYPTTTNNDGFYNFPRIPVGRYEVKVENGGFRTAVQPGILLQLNQNAKVDFHLEVGDITQTVEVTSASPILQTENSQLGTVIDARTNTQLPLATRNYVQLTLLAPGSVHPDPSSFKNGQTTASSGRPYINGNREQTNNFLLDGMDNNQVSDNEVGYAPSPDAIQEFNLITQNASAEFGNFMGGIVSASIKSGSNQFHGDLFEFFRNDKLNANEWSNNFAPDGGIERQPMRWNEFGASLGGPILRDKLFFFVDYQGQRFVTPKSYAVSVLTPLERQGNFSELLAQGKQLNYPGTTTPIAGNIIPTNLLSPTALSIVNSQYYPLPTSSGLNQNLINSNPGSITGDQGDAKVDWNRSEKDRIFGRYSQSQISNPSTNSVPFYYNSFANYPTHNGVLDWTRTISPSLVNDARFGVNYVYINNGASPNGAGNLGIPGVNAPFVPGMYFSGGNLSNNTGGTGSSIQAIGNSDVAQLFADTVIQYSDTVIWTKGSHTMHIGFQGQRQRINTFYSGNNGIAGSFFFNGQYSGLAESDFLLGLPDTIGGGVAGGTWGQRANIFSGFFQDDWRVRSNLTVNLGLRYEIHTPWVEVNDRQVNFGLINGAIELPGQNGNSDALYNTYNGIGNWQPRVGFAWTPFGGKTVVRGGYSLSSYLEGTGTNLRLTINPPYATEHTLLYTSQNLPSSTLDQGFTPFNSQGGTPCNVTTVTSAPASCFSGAGLRVWDPNVRPALVNQWNFTVQHEFGNSTTLQAGYVGQKSSHLVVAMPYLQRELLPNGSVVNSPYLSGNPTLQNEIGQISGTASTGNQSYNALQVTLQKRLSNGLQYQASYTWSKCMTDSIGYYGASAQAAPTSPYWQNLYDRKAEWGPCYYDSTHIFTGFITYDLPFGHNRTFGKNLNKVVNAFVGDWQVNAIASFHGGFPLTVSASTDPSGTNSRGERANCLAPAHVNGNLNSSLGGYQWFDPSAFADPTSGFGTCGVGTVRGPGLRTVDLSVSKLFQTFEHQNLELRGEFINVSNTPILNAPSTGVGSTLGLIQSSQGARNIQIALKYNF
jgi:hypothetical protein